MPAPGDLDPIFQAEEPKRPVRKSTVLLWQFFFFPVLIVAAAVGVFLLFGAIGGSVKSPQELLEIVLSGGENEQQQASQQLAILIAEERSRVDALREEGEEFEDPPFYARPAFRKGLQEALSLALEEESSERQQMLARALGRTGDTTAIPLLRGILFPPAGESPAPADVRRAAALGLAWMERRETEPALIEAARDKLGDAQVRVIAYNGLALLGLPRFGGAAHDDPQVHEVLLKGLEDPTAGVQLNAAYGLAVRGDGAGRHLLARSLDRDELRSLNIPDAYHAAALANAVRGAAYLGDASLQPLVQRLTNEDHEPDARVRELACEALERWGREDND